VTEGREVERESEYKKPWFQSKCCFSIYHLLLLLLFIVWKRE